MQQAHYDMVAGGQPVGEERLVVGVAGGKRVIVAQVVADYGGRIQTSYRIGPETTTVDVKSPFGAFQLAGKVTAGKLVVTGSDATGKPISLAATLPAGAFLSGPGMGRTWRPGPWSRAATASLSRGRSAVRSRS